MTLTNEQAQQIASIAVALHRSRRELAQHETSPGIGGRAAREPRAEVGRLEVELAAAIDALEQPTQ